MAVSETLRKVCAVETIVATPRAAFSQKSFPGRQTSSRDIRILDKLGIVMAIESARGASVEHAGRVLRPVAQTLTLRLPRAGGFVWNRPLGVEVEEQGRRSFVRVPDRTRQIQWLLLGTGLALGFLIRRIRRRRRAWWTILGR